MGAPNVMAAWAFPFVAALSSVSIPALSGAVVLLFIPKAGVEGAAEPNGKPELEEPKPEAADPNAGIVEIPVPTLGKEAGLAVAALRELLEPKVKEEAVAFVGAFKPDADPVVPKAKVLDSAGAFEAGGAELPKANAGLFSVDVFVGAAEPKVKAAAGVEVGAGRAGTCAAGAGAEACWFPEPKVKAALEAGFESPELNGLDAPKLNPPPDEPEN